MKFELPGVCPATIATGIEFSPDGRISLVEGSSVGVIRKCLAKEARQCLFERSRRSNPQVVNGTCELAEITPHLVPEVANG